MNKFNIGEGLSDAVQHLKKGWKRYLFCYLILVVISIISGIAIVALLLDKFYANPKPSLDFFNDIRGIVLVLGLIIGYFSMVMQAIIIKVTDDLIEHRTLTFRQQFTFAFKKSGKIILANIMALIPLLILVGIMIGSLFNIGSGGLGLYFICLIGILIYTVFIAFISQSIITEDVTSIEAIGRSFAVAKNNFFRYSLTIILLGIFSMIIQKIFSDTSIMIVVLNTLASSIISAYVVVFITSLYKQVTKIDNSEPELEYFENLDI